MQQPTKHLKLLLLLLILPLLLLGSIPNHSKSSQTDSVTQTNLAKSATVEIVGSGDENKL